MGALLDFDKFMELKNTSKLKAFVFLLNNEYPYLNETTTWLDSVGCPVYVVRLTKQEFHMLDIGKHPKIVFFKKGKEILECEGTPNLRVLKTELNKIK